MGWQEDDPKSRKTVTLEDRETGSVPHELAQIERYQTPGPGPSANIKSRLATEASYQRGLELSKIERAVMDIRREISARPQPVELSNIERAVRELRRLERN